MSNLRSEIIRIAFEHPETRPHLLPLVTAADSKSFEEAIKGKKFKHPETGNRVLFKSLPSEEQTKIRKEWKSKSEGSPKAKKTKKTPANFAKRRLFEKPSHNKVIQAAHVAWKRLDAHLKKEKELFQPFDDKFTSAVLKASLVVGREDALKKEDLPAIRKIPGLEKAKFDKNGRIVVKSGEKTLSFRPSLPHLVSQDLFDAMNPRLTEEGKKLSEEMQKAVKLHDEMVDFRNGRKKGDPISDEELKRRFMKEASPESKERVKDMSPEEFRIALRSLLDEEE